MFLTKRFYLATGIAILFLIAGVVHPAVFIAGKTLVLLIILLTVSDIVLLWKQKRPAQAERFCAPRFSNGDFNNVRLEINNLYPFMVSMEIIDEIPIVFQRRDILFKTRIKANEQATIRYKLRPVQRGVYDFGYILLYVSSRIGFVSRRIRTASKLDVAVYPSYIMLHKYEFLAIHNNLSELGIKKIRRRGNNTEFESIKEYTRGDDYRTINWKASARRHFPMVNVRQDERSQQIYSVIDKGRIMQSAFNGMTLLDYAINASLVLSFVAIRKHDKAGLATFAEDFETFIPADKQTGQMQRILESLFRQQTSFGESDYSALYVHINKFINKRSLLIVYTNFDTLTGMERQLGYLRQLSKQHVVLAVFFEDVEMKQLADKQPCSVDGYYKQIIADKFVHDKRLVAMQLQQFGIFALLTEPDKLSVNLINKYLELKAKGVI
jgi:uncharacterized protein (DUF58 family)